ncbi:hypothetical protein [Tenacibaculum maritimum]|nr:hypothetical protein [Tenacibaculum maritimum]CAA0152301.1 hypothetical protein TMP227_100025 [Tenacibaculum maritimum]
MIVQKYYGPTETYENYNTETGVWTNNYDQEIREPMEYDPSEGYTPFGDE